MSHAHPDPQQPSPAAEAPADPAVRRAEERLVMLRELAEIGMRLTRALERRVLAEEDAVENPPAAAQPAGDRASRFDTVAAFASLSRAVRLTLTLEARTDEALSALKAGVEQTREEERATAREAEVSWRKDREEHIRDLVLEAAEGDMRDKADRERLDSELGVQLMVDEDFWSDPARPIRQIVERYCEYFQLLPDWSRFDGEDWIEDDPVWPWAAARLTDPGPSPIQNGAAAHDLE